MGPGLHEAAGWNVMSSTRDQARIVVSRAEEPEFAVEIGDLLAIGGLLPTAWSSTTRAFPGATLKSAWSERAGIA